MAERFSGYADIPRFIHNFFFFLACAYDIMPAHVHVKLGLYTLHSNI